MSQIKHKLQYIGSFDCIRGIATLFVLLIHGSYGFFKGAWIALDLFFVLSGFLITTLLYNEYFTSGKISFSNFYARRALKIFPPLIICILLANILWPFTRLSEDADNTLATAGAFLYFSNFLQVKIMGNMHHLWSLSVEEHFYFLWPLLMVFFILKASFRKQTLFLVTSIVAVSIFRIFVFNHHFSSELFMLDPYRSTFSRIDGIMMGAMLCFILKDKSLDLRTENKPVITLTLGIFVCAFLFILFSVSEVDFYWNNGGFIITNLLCTITIWIAIKEPNHFFFSSKILRWVGKRSYSIYLYHIPIFLFFENFRQPHDLTNLVLITLLRFAISIAMAALSYKYIEHPILKLKKRYGVYKMKNRSIGGFNKGLITLQSERN
jgi:peptidoglycan/LPS O-acetylase OafA/YrhL